MSQIVVYRDPQPDIKKPSFVKEAYVGLILTPVFAAQPGECGPFPQGVHMVPLGELLRALCLVNDRSYRWHVARWGKIENTTKSYNDVGILLPFPFDCCDVREVVH